jgi:16S rRNA processing protein RimM
MADGEADPRPMPDHLIVGHVSKPHGTRGEVFVWPLTDRPDEVFVAGREIRVGGTGGELSPQAPTTVVEAEPRPFKRGLLVKFEGRDDRASVDELAGRYLLVPITDVAPLEEGEVFYHQLLGLDVVTVEGQRVGKVQEVYETEPAHLLEIRSDEGRLHLVPFAERIVKELDVKDGRIVIKPPPGLLEL